MIDGLMLFPSAADPGVLDEILAKLIPVIKATPGLRSLRVSDGDLMARGGPPPYSRVIEVSVEALPDWFALVQALNGRPDFAELSRIQPLVVYFEAREP